MINRPHIMVFDSGAGGLSIAKTILTSTPNPLRLSYFADRSAFPYGNKEESFLIQHVSNLIGEFIHQHQPDLIVIACNTASTIVLPELRRRFTCPFVGVVPAIKPAASLSVSKCIGVLATPATVNRDYTSSLIKEFAPDCKVVLYGSDTLVRCAESFIEGSPINMEIIDKEIRNLLEQQDNIDTVVLACTHFPLIADAFKTAAPQVSHWVDSSGAIARRTLHLLEAHYLHTKILHRATAPVTHDIDIFFSTDELEDTSIERLHDNYKRFLDSARSTA